MMAGRGVMPSPWSCERPEHGKPQQAGRHDHDQEPRRRRGKQQRAAVCGDPAPGQSMLVALHRNGRSHGARSFWLGLSLIHISEPTRLGMRSYAVFCLKKKKKKK